MTKLSAATETRLRALESAIDAYAPVFQKLTGAKNLADYLVSKTDRADEEILTEPILRSIIEVVLGFPKGRYLEQLSRSGRKPDFTPEDLLAHRFVLDAKSTDQSLPAHEHQIRMYMSQRRLDHGILFNLREFRVFARGKHGADAALTFPVLPLWQLIRGEALPGDEVERFERFCDLFAYREVSSADKALFIAKQPPWPVRFQGSESFAVDVEALVERLRRLSLRLAEDAASRVDDLDTFVALNPDRERKLLEELALLAQDVAPGTDPKHLPEDLADWRAGEGVVATVWRQYTLRVAYLALARILLYRAWEDVEFVKSYLHDGGFERWYTELEGQARAVLEEAFLHGGERYPWLFGGDNNYSWYRPGEEALIDVLYALAPEPLGRLDADVLGSLYATYVEDIDRDRLGQFFTPRDVVRFMLDAAGFAGPDRVFQLEGDARKPVAVFDFATGSGGFLVEAAHRVIDAVDPSTADAKGLLEALRAVVQGLTGSEISPFPYYLTEINLLLQASRVLGPLQTLQQGPQTTFPALGVLPVDTLAAKSGAATLDASEVGGDDRLGLVQLDGAKREIYRDRLRPDESFDFVIGNPPYVAEANNKPLFDRLRAIPAWKGVYRGKTDYLYYFLLLAIDKLRSGGTLAVITPAAWMNAGVADFLRKRLLDDVTLDRLFLFGSYRVFATDDAAPTPTVESAILIGRKQPAPKKHKVRVVVLEDESAAPVDRHELLDEMRKRSGGKAGRRGGILVHDIDQASLRADRPWPVKFGAKDVGTLVVAHLQAQLDDESCEPLERSWKVARGIETAADTYTKRIDKRLTSAQRHTLQMGGAQLGDPIMELPAGSEGEQPWRDFPNLLARAPEPSAILYGLCDPEDYTVLLRIAGSSSPSGAILEYLEKWRPILASRAGFADFPNRGWWETHRARNDRELSAPKVISLYRTDRGRFALDEMAEWKPSNKSTFVVGREPDAPVAYLCGILNSELLDLWYGVRGKTPRDVWRNYEPLRMNEMPYRPPAGDPRADEIAMLVRQMAANRRALLPHRSVIAELERTVKDPWKTGPVEVSVRGLVAELPASETVSLRLAPHVELDFTEATTAKVRRAKPGLIELTRGKKVVGTIASDEATLDLVEAVVGASVDETLSEALVPKDLTSFQAAVEARRALVADLLREGRELVERIERLVCAMYDVPADLTDEVVAHAVRRAG